MIEANLPNKPDMLALAAQHAGFFPALLESQSYNTQIGRFDLLMAAPSMELVAYDAEQLDHLLNTIDGQPNQPAGKGPFQYGWLVYFSYESAYFMEPKLAHLINPTREPLVIAIYCQGAIVHDHHLDQTTLWAENDWVAQQIKNRLIDSTKLELPPMTYTEIEEEEGEQFKQAVEHAKGLIRSGDIYQANLSRQYHCQSDQNLIPAAIFSQLRNANPAPFAALLQTAGFAIASSSPERLLSIKNNTIETRPIAGTRPRGINSEADQQLIDELLDTPKERAEHIMLIDLERNDIGKVCVTGSVEVDELMVVETYQHVHHIVSNIKGQLLSDKTIVAAIKALFPGGTITGCPKIRCMEVIHQIEQRDRGCYTGSMGYINHDGQVDLNILIRTVGIHDDQVTFNAGAGIVYDSNPEAELFETRHKAKGMIKALQPDSNPNVPEVQGAP